LALHFGGPPIPPIGQSVNQVWNRKLVIRGEYKSHHRLIGSVPELLCGVLRVVRHDDLL
jgi:hypothetical protein